ncbi:MAG TPA: ArdC-like ssDNA-binding domain-containing protein [Candidatus Dormibacteraeota bacterium]|nr:ArdC-like ssDNA-binding domain-containing protein [Candidatus Dormibacteraeota bacterium]
MVTTSAPSQVAPVSTEGRHTKAELLNQLTQGVLDLTSSAAWSSWLRTSRRFHHYSFQNQVLILQQRPDATWVAGYRSWLRLGRQVRQGERAIRILAPCLSAREGIAGEESPPPTVLGFRVARVFDLSQTDGTELPQPVSTLMGEGSAAELAKLTQRAWELDFQVQFIPLWGSRNGDCSHALRRIRVRDDLPRVHKLKTLAHELAHAVLHGPEFQGSRALAELEAESVAYLVCQELGVDSADYSFGYVASWSGGGPEAARLIAATGGRILLGKDKVLEDTRPRPPTEAGETSRVG